MIDLAGWTAAPEGERDPWSDGGGPVTPEEAAALSARGIEVGSAWFEGDEMRAAPRWAYVVSLAVDHGRFQDFEIEGEGPEANAVRLGHAVDRIFAVGGLDAVDSIIRSFPEREVVSDECEEALRAYLNSIGALP